MMGKRTWLGVVAVVAMLVALALVPTTAGAADYTKNTDCMKSGCHNIGWGLDFNVGAVNYATACRKCHVDTLVGTHPYHNTTSICGSYCHQGWGENANSLAANVPVYLDTAGAFASAQSQATTASVLHIIHATPRWPSTVNTVPSKCQSCHATAACSACHNGTPAPSTTLNQHVNHGGATRTVDPWVGDVSPGVTGGDQTQLTMSEDTTVSCGDGYCHDTAGVAANKPSTIEDRDDVRVTTVGAWRTRYGSAYTNGSMTLANRAGMSLTATFTGQRVSFVTDLDPYRGTAEVRIDGALQTTIDQYSGVTKNQKIAWTSSKLATGTHTITITATGNKNGSSRAAYISVDQFEFYPIDSGTVAPFCGGCHPTKVNIHSLAPTSTFTHEATQTADNLYNTYRCDSCHMMVYRSEHKDRPSSSSAGTSCELCHTSYAPYTWTGSWNTNDGCNYSSCHPSSASTRTPHPVAGVTAGHTATTDATEAPCRDCHGTDLGTAHNNQYPANAYATNCNTCHTASLYPAGKACATAGCHVASGVTTVTAHSFDSVRHTPTTFTRTYQATFATHTIDSGGKECNLCHYATVDSKVTTQQAHYQTSAGQVSCNGCHNNTSLNSRSVAASGWPGERCGNCHDALGNRSHNTTATSHNVVVGTCAGTSSGCHQPTNLWDLHDNNQAGGAPSWNNCQNAGCHDANNKGTRPTMKTCGQGNECHTDKTPTHSSSFSHTFTGTSQYNSAATTASAEAGCTNAGSGCHLASAATTNFAGLYHPASGCTDGGADGNCHEFPPGTPNPSKAAFTGILPTDCQECHATGAFTGAAARSKLASAPASGGHYNETTHTATGMTTTLTAGGSAGATCNACHSPTVGGAYTGALMNQHTQVSIGGSPYGSTVGCGECHNDTRAYGYAEVVANWTNNTCADCHKVGATASVLDHAGSVPSIDDTQTTSCGATGTNCHTSKELHNLHRNAAGGCNLTGCHDYTKQAFVPTAQSCGAGGACHNTYTNATAFTHAKSQETTAHAPTTGNIAQADANWAVGGGNYSCQQCHIVTRAQGGLYSYEHTSTYSTKTVDSSNVCRNCHNNAASTAAITSNWSAKDTTGACAQCHTGGLAIHANENTGAHTVTTNTGCGNMGVGCHPTNDFSSTGATATAANTVIHRSCVRCHDRTGATTWSSAQIGASGTVVYNPNVKACGQATGCHLSSSYNNTTYQHRIGRGDVVTGDDARHVASSTAMASTLTSGVASAACSACHSSTLALAHKVTSTTANLGSTNPAWTNACTGCHNNTLSPVAGAPTVVKNNWPNDTCAECHASYHNTLNSGHTGTSSLGCGASGNGCHTTYDLRVLHGQTKTNGCNLSGCHNAVDKAMGSGPKNCENAACHSAYTFTNHGTVTTGNEVATHETTVTGFSTKVDGATWDAMAGASGAHNACSDCHSRGLATAHKETSTTANLKSGGSWTPASPAICQDCHNTSSPDNATTVVKTDNWNARTCDQCHVTRGNGYHSTASSAASHTASTGGCALGSCHGGSTDVRAIHMVDKANRGCTAVGSDLGGGNWACHRLDKQMNPGTAMSCGSGSGGCHTDARYVSGGHGSSNGGAACYGCHSSLRDSMEMTGTSRTNSYHHVLGSTGVGGDYAPGAGSYQTSTTAVYCTSCHVDHDKFNADKGSNLRTTIVGTSATATNTDFTAGTQSGICVTCHATSLAKDNFNQKPGTGVAENVPYISGSQYVGGTHQYSVTTTFGTSPFKADCVKCHDDNTTAAYQSGSFATHFSPEKRLLSLLGATPQVGDEAQEDACFRCHSTTSNAYAGSGKDGFNVRSMSTTSLAIQGLFGRASTHPVINTTQGQVECQSCHNTHLATTTTETADPDNTYNRLPYTTKANTTAFCIKCHDGSLPTKQVNGTTYVPADVSVIASELGQMKKDTYASKAHWTANGSISAGEIAACADCHDQHGSNAPKLLGVSVAGGANMIGAQTITANDKTVCFGCHTNASTSFPNAASHTSSGYPMDGTWPGASVWNTTHNATTRAGSAHSEPTVIWPGYTGAGTCRTCHDVHGTNNTYDIMRGTSATSSYTPGNQEFCFVCHSNAPAATVDIQQYYPVSFGGTSTADNAGHNIQSPGAALVIGSGQPCYNCHNPHGSASSYGLQVVTMTGVATTITVGDAAGELNMNPSTRTATDIRNFCFTCHTSSSGQNGWNGSQMTSVTGGTIMKISRITYNTTGKYGLKLPNNIQEHQDSSSASCYQCHLSDYSSGVSYNVHNPSPGISQGNRQCYGCHSSYQTYMEDNQTPAQGASRTAVYHHVLGSGTTTATQGDAWFAQGAYPINTDNVYCVSCHVDHNLFNGTKARNLRTQLNATAVATDTDFSVGTQTGICQSCHNATKAKDTTNQKPGTGVAENVPAINGANFLPSAHQYYVNSQFADGTQFKANCTKCHSDESLKQYQTSTAKYSVHWSQEAHILQSLGAALATGDEAQENHCYECHSTDNNPYGGAGKDGHNTASMNATATAIKGMFQLTSRHPVVNSNNVECQNCHNVHIQTSATETADPDNTYNKMGFTTEAEKATYCLRCHDGGAPAKAIGATYVPQTVTIDATDTTRVNKNTYAARAHWTQFGSIGASDVRGCGSCHDNHGSSVEHLLGTRSVPNSNNVINSTVITANDYTVCGACHTSASTSYPNQASHTSSGYPNDGTWPGMTVYNNATTGIHRVGRANVTTSTFSAGDCKNCHDVHGTANTYDELKGIFTEANFQQCFQCHDGTKATTNIKQFFPVSAGGTVANGTSRAGHLTVTAGTFPAGTPTPCYMCHNPHGSSSPDGLQVTVQTSVGTTTTIGDSNDAFIMSGSDQRRFCLACHTAADNASAWGGSLGTITVASGVKVMGIDRISTGAKLRLPNTQTAHNAASTSECDDCHGSTYTAGGRNVHYPDAGGSGGPCFTCHSNYQAMVSSTTVYHHVLDAADPQVDPGVSPSYPTSQTSLACVSCHTGHQNFSTNLGANLRTDIAVSSGAATNTDFTGTGTGGICTSCHSVALTKNGTGQRGKAASTTPVISVNAYSNSAHNYSVNTTFGTSTFKANCSKCHDDEQDSGSKMSGTWKIGTHFSSSSGLARALGATLPVGAGELHTVEENLCYRCHQGDTAGTDAYGVKAMTARARNIQSSYAKAYRHAVASSTTTGRHTSDEYNFAPANINGTSTATPGWYKTGNAERHSECEDCHNPHYARAENTTEFPDINNRRGSTAVTISPANEGVWGVNITGPTNTSTNGNWLGSSATSGAGNPAIPYYSKIATAQYEWQFCLKCHSRYAWGNQTTPTVPSGGVNAVQGVQMTDVGRDFNPANYAFHPLFAIGRNQPPTATINVWDANTTYKRVIGGQANGWGLTNTFVDGWFAWSRVTCSDCHGNDTWGASTIARGVHGSSRKWLVRGINLGIRSTKAGGVFVNSSLASPFAGSYCLNCHRAEVYGDGDADDAVAGAATMSRADHASSFNSCDANTRVPNQVNGCNNCHGGRSAVAAASSRTNGLIHGSDWGVSSQHETADTNAMGFRFANGASWDDHVFARTGTADYLCYTIDATDTFSQCNQHNGTGFDQGTPLYRY